jgi:hypothetical protein
LLYDLYEENMLRNIPASDLCFDILRSELHLPLVNGKANQDAIEDAITIGMMQKELGIVSQENVDLAIELINDFISLYSIKQ